jgi:hypothetical protein
MIETILGFLQIVKMGLEVIDRFRGDRRTGTTVGPNTVATFRQAVRHELGDHVAQRIKSDSEVQQGLTLMATALADWQVSSTPLCPLLLRKAIAFGMEEKNLGLVPASEDHQFIESAYQEWKAWIDQGARNNEGLLVFLLEAPHRDTIDLIQELNQRKTSLYHKPRFGCLDVRSRTFYGPPRGLMDQYALTFGVDTFWNEIMKGVGYLVT